VATRYFSRKNRAARSPKLSAWPEWVSQKLASSDENKEVKDIRNKKVIDNPKHIQCDKKEKVEEKRKVVILLQNNFDMMKKKRLKK